MSSILRKVRSYLGLEKDKPLTPEQQARRDEMIWNRQGGQRSSVASQEEREAFERHEDRRLAARNKRKEREYEAQSQREADLLGDILARKRKGK